MPWTRPTTDYYRAIVSSAVAVVIATGAVALLFGASDVRTSGTAGALITTFVFLYPVYAVIYVGWGVRAYRRLDPARLRDVAVGEHRADRRWLRRALGMTGTANTTISAAVVAVAVTIGIAQTPEFRSEHIYLAGGLLTVASAWVLMVYSFAQAYLRVAAVQAADAPIRFPFSDEPLFGDYLTLAILMSTMAATVSAEITTRSAWRLARANVIVAFAFNTVIIAMTVSLLFGSIAQ